MSRKELRFGQPLLISWPQSLERRWTLLSAPNHGRAAEPPFPSWAACLSSLNHDSASLCLQSKARSSDPGWAHSVRVVLPIQVFLPRKRYAKAGGEEASDERACLPHSLSKGPGCPGRVSGNLSTVCMLRTVRFASKTAGRMSLPSLGTGSSLNTSLTMRRGAALYGRNVSSCRLFYSHCPALITRWNNLAWTYYLKVTKFIRGRKINAELPMHVLRPCSPFHFCDTQAVIFVFCNCLVSPLLLLML